MPSTLRITHPYGSRVPLAFDQLSYLGYVPTDHSGITYRLLVKDIDDAATDDASALVDVSNDELTLNTAPFEIAYEIDTEEDGWLGYGLYACELWVDDATRGKHRVSAFQLYLEGPTRKTFA